MEETEDKQTIEETLNANESKRKALDVKESWKRGLSTWNTPPIPYVISIHNEEDLKNLGEVGEALRDELAFMKFPEFQTYQNLETIAKAFSEDPQRGLTAVNKHEIGHRFCPYNTVTLILLNHEVLKVLKGKDLAQEQISSSIVNLFTDMCDNTRPVRQGDEDLPWAYEQLSKERADSSFWRVYARSMEHAWRKQILPEGTKLSEKEEEASKQLSSLFEKDYSRTYWREKISQYARVISDFYEEDKQNRDNNNPNEKQENNQSKKGLGKRILDKIKGKGKSQGENQDSSQTEADSQSKGDNGKQDKYGSGFDNIIKNIPKNLDDKTAKELAKRLAEIGNNGLPTNSSAIEEFKDTMAGFGQGNPTQASIQYYDMLSDSYNVMFATQPFGRPRVNPFQPIKWHPGMSIDKLDIYYSAQVGGRIIPGVNTYAWNSRKREVQGGIEEVVLDLDLYLDSSMSMPNPLSSISLPVLAGFVVSKKAHKKGAKIQSTNFSGQGQYNTIEFTRDLNEVYKNLVTFYGGGTVFPYETLLKGDNPRQALIITDTFLGNMQETADAISALRSKNKHNRISVYAMHSVAEGDILKQAGADVIYGTSTDIFKKVIGKAGEIY